MGRANDAGNEDLIHGRNGATDFFLQPSVSMQIEWYREKINTIKNDNQFHPEKYASLDLLKMDIDVLMAQYQAHPLHQPNLASLKRQLDVAMRVYAPDPVEGIHAYRTELQWILNSAASGVEKGAYLWTLQQEMASFVDKYRHYVIHRDDIAALETALSTALHTYSSPGLSM